VVLLPAPCCHPGNGRQVHERVSHSLQLDSTHWLLIFIHENGTVSTVMDSAEFIDVITDQANSAP
jgi:hypothetical protein